MNYIRISLVVLLFLLVHHSINAQTRYSILGTWRVCTKIELDTNEMCNTDSYVTYTFNRDGSYFDSRQYTINGIAYNMNGRWVFRNDTLTIDANDGNGFTFDPQNHIIKWVNSRLFYTYTQEGNTGVFRYTIFRKVN